MEGKDAVIISACESASLINESFIQFDRISFPASTALHLRYIYCHMSQSEAVLVAQISLHWCSYNLRYVTKIISWLIVIA